MGDHSYRAERGAWERGGGGFFPFLVILGTLPACNWSVRAYGYFKLGHLMSLFALPVCIQLRGCCGPFYLNQVSIAQASCLKVA